MKIKIKDLVNDLTYNEIKSRKWRYPKICRNNKIIIFKDYIVSQDGIFLRLTRQRGTSPGKIKSIHTKVRGYSGINLTLNGIKFPSVYVHILMYETWVKIISEGLELNHKDGIKTNFQLYNLEEVTHRENILHAKESGLAFNPEQRFRMGSHNRGKKLSIETRKKIGISKKRENLSEETLKKMSVAQSGENNPMYGRRGEDCPFSKLDNEKVLRIRYLSYIEGWNQYEIAKEINVSQQSISSVVIGKTWNPDELTKQELIQQTIKENQHGII